MPPSNALTIASNGGLLNVLGCPIRVTTPIAAAGEVPERTTSDVMAVWDTGATGSVITQAIVGKLGIAPIGLTQVHGVNSTDLSEVYLVDFHFPMGVVIRGLNVTLGALVGIDALVGMDVITAGDFSITNKNGRTKMSFRVPSQIEVDYVEESNRQGMSRAERRHPGKAQPRPPRPKR